MNDRSQEDRPVSDRAGSQPVIEGSALEGMGEATWNEEEGVAYEVAIEGINQVIGAYSGLIGDEKMAAAPDNGKIAAWREARLQWTGRRRALSPGDVRAVQVVRRETADLLRDLSGRR